MRPTDKILADALIQKKSFARTEMDRHAVDAEALRKPLGAHLIRKGLMSRDELLDILADVFTGEDGGPEQEVHPRIITNDAIASDFDKRLYTRIAEKVEVRYKVNRQEITDLAVMMIPDVEYSAGTQDISAGGLMFICGHPVPLGTILELRIMLDKGNGYIDCFAKVCRVNKEASPRDYCVSVYYLDISSSDRVKVNNFISQKIAAG